MDRRLDMIHIHITDILVEHGLRGFIVWKVLSVRTHGQVTLTFPRLTDSVPGRRVKLQKTLQLVR